MTRMYKYAYKFYFWRGTSPVLLSKICLSDRHIQNHLLTSQYTFDRRQQQTVGQPMNRCLTAIADVTSYRRLCQRHTLHSHIYKIMDLNRAVCVIRREFRDKKPRKSCHGNIFGSKIQLN